MAILTRIEISDTRLENATSTMTAEINPPDDLRIDFTDSKGSGSVYANHLQLPTILKQVSDRWNMIRKLNIVFEFEDDEAIIRANKNAGPQN